MLNTRSTRTLAPAAPFWPAFSRLISSWLILSGPLLPALAADELLEQPAPPSAPSTVDTAKYDLAYKFQSGDVLRWEVVHRAAVDTTIQGTNQTAETRSTSIKVWRVSDVAADGQITFVHSVESIDMWQKMQGRQEVRYNSQTDKDIPAGYEDVAKAVGVPLTVVKIDRRGKVISREEKLQRAAADNAPIAVPLPAEPVKIGHVWSAPVDMDVRLPGGATKKIATRQQFTLKQVADGLATIEVDTQVLTPVHDAAIEAQLVQRLTQGWLKFDIEHGRMASQQLELDRRVLGFSGAASSMHCQMRLTEELLPQPESVAKAIKKKRPLPVGSQPARR